MASKRPAGASAPTIEPAKKRVFTPRPPRPAAERLPQLYRALTDQVNDGYFQNAIKTCKKILNLDAKSDAAFQTLLFLHLHTDDYPSALDLVISRPDAEKSLQFERAYCLYRLHREKEALQVLEGRTDKGRREMHLEAQIRYRLGEYERAQQLYDDLLGSVDVSSPEQPDIVTNLSATSAHLDFLSHGFHSQIPSSSGADLETQVPSLPAGWATGGTGSSTSAAPKKVVLPAQTKGVEKKETKEKKRRHKLPKGAVEGKLTNLDPERWIPLRQRQSYITAMSKKKGAKESMGTGFTQGSTAHPSGAGGGGGGGGGGGKKKKGKK